MSEKLTDKLARLVARVNNDDCDTDERDAACAEIYRLIGPTPREVLKQILFYGPVFDGSIISKAGRGVLFDYGLAVRCCLKGEQGFTAASYLGYSVYKHGYKEAAERLLPTFLEKRKTQP
jgi:hypothetical protein